MCDKKPNNDKFFLFSTTAFVSLSYFLAIVGMLKVTHYMITNVFATYMLIASILAFYRTTYITPGFLPFKNTPSFELQPCHLKNNIDIVPDVLNNSRLIVLTSEQNAKTTYVQKYCQCCNSFRPIRTSHCNDLSLIHI